MTYDIVFAEKPGRGFADSVFFSGLPTSPKVFVLFYRGSTDTSEVEERLRALGQKTGDNLFVNIASQSDPSYSTARNRFGIRRWPVIVVTAISPLAATPEGDNAFVRLDGKSLFANADELVRTVEELFNLFLGGEIARAIVTGWTEQGQALLRAAAERVWSIARPVITWIAEKDLTIDFLGVQIKVKSVGRH